MDAALEDVDFLARSANRVAVLEALEALDPEPIERRDLEDETGISRPTLSRILDDLEVRGWIDRDRHRYAVTRRGSLAVGEFTALLRRFEALRSLDDVVEWFPPDGFGFDLGCLVDAAVVRPHRNDALAPTTHIVERLDVADRARILSYTVFPAGIEACWRATLDGRHRLEAVFDSGAMATVAADATMVDRSREMFETDRARMFHYDGDVPYVLFVIDDAYVDLCLGSRDGAPRAVIESEDETVLAWAEATFDAYRRDARQLDEADFSS